MACYVYIAAPSATAHAGYAASSDLNRIVRDAALEADSDGPQHGSHLLKLDELLRPAHHNLVHVVLGQAHQLASLAPAGSLDLVSNLWSSTSSAFNEYAAIRHVTVGSSHLHSFPFVLPTHDIANRIAHTSCNKLSSPPLMHLHRPATGVPGTNA